MDTDHVRRATDQEREIAGWLLAREAAGNKSQEGLTDGTLKALARLDGRLSDLIGSVGYEALLRRALYLAQTECSLLADVKVGPPAEGPGLEGLRESMSHHHPGDVHRCLVTLLAEFIWLLASFIGIDLTRHLIRGVWPDFAVESGSSGSEEKDR